MRDFFRSGKFEKLEYFIIHNDLITGIQLQHELQITKSVG